MTQNRVRQANDLKQSSPGQSAAAKPQSAALGLKIRWMRSPERARHVIGSWRLGSPFQGLLAWKGALSQGVALRLRRGALPWAGLWLPLRGDGTHLPLLKLLAPMLVGCVMQVAAGTLYAQVPGEQLGEVVPRDVREMYGRGLQYLAGAQKEEGDWDGGPYSGAGVTGMAVMAFLASGEDPNFGLYSSHVRRGLRSMIRKQDAETGIIGDSMYHHGFAMLALAEAYGAVDDRNLWREGVSGGSNEETLRSIGESLELAVRAALTSQKKNPLGAWRYTPDAKDADTSVSGAVLVGLLGARNAGIEVPDEAIDRAIAYYRNMTSPTGQVAYSGGIAGGVDESPARISIASLVYAVARRKDLDEYKATIARLGERLERPAGSWIQYARYYQAQALFQGDLAVWEKWNQQLVRELKQAQQEDGSFSGEFGPAVDTSLSLLALALNFRFLPIYER